MKNSDFPAKSGENAVSWRGVTWDEIEDSEIFPPIHEITDIGTVGL